MSAWITYLQADPSNWLKEEDNPSVRYLALIELQGMLPGSSQAKGTKSAIMSKGAVPLILARQEEGGYWSKPERFYTAKYQGAVWQLIVLAEHLADGADDRVRRACEFIIDRSQDQESGGFSMHQSVKQGGGRHGEVLPCLTGNMVWSLIRLGFLDDIRVQRGIDWLTRYQRFDDAVDTPPQGWPYDRYEICWGRHTCHMGVVKALKALAEIPLPRRTAVVERTIDAGVEFLLRHHVFKRSHDLAKVSKPGWRRFGFPLMYQTDVLEILVILTQLGCRDRRLQEAIDLVLSKQAADGRWKLENTFNGHYQVDIEVKGQPSKWITLNALRVLKRYYG